MKINKLIRKQTELLKQFKECKTRVQYADFNNGVILPLYNQVRNEILTRCKAQNFEPFTSEGYVFEDFNDLHDIEYFLVELSKDCTVEVGHLDFIKNGWCSIDVG